VLRARQTLLLIGLLLFVPLLYTLHPFDLVYQHSFLQVHIVTFDVTRSRGEREVQPSCSAAALPPGGDFD
jgi:hypothetical protein